MRSALERILENADATQTALKTGPGGMNPVRERRSSASLAEVGKRSGAHSFLHDHIDLEPFSHYARQQRGAPHNPHTRADVF